MAALGLAVTLGFSMRRRASANPGVGWHRLIRGEALTLAGGLGLAAVLVGLPDPEPAVVVAAPGLAHVRMGDEAGTLLLVDRNGTSGWLQYVAGDDDAPAVAITDGSRRTAWHPGNEHAETTAVALRDGAAHLTVRYAGHRVAVRLPAAAPVAAAADDPTAADPGEALQFALGRAVAAVATHTTQRQVATTCVRTPSAVDEGRAFATTLRTMGITRVAARGDGSRRARAFASGLATRGVTLSGDASALLLTGDASSAINALTHLGGRVPSRGIYLAPWLLDSDVLAVTKSRALPAVAVGSIVDPMSPLADRYRGALAVLAPRAQLTEAGLLGFLSVASSEAFTPALRVYAAAPVGFLPGILNVGHEHDVAAAWFPNGTLAPITAVQRMDSRCALPA
jgi:hypothetical protein